MAARRWATLLCVALGLLTARPVRADVADDRRALVMLRILAYDKRLADRAGATVVVAVVFAATEASAAERTRWTTAFAHIGNLKVGGRPIAVVAVRVDTARQLEQDLRAAHAAAAIVCDGVEATLALRDVAAATRAARALSLTTREADVIRGLAVGVVPGKKRDEIVVNIGSATAEGVKFDAGLLQLARTVEDDR
jgi:hypothetical protein